MSAFDELIAFARKTQALAGIAGRLGWDQETMMPRGAAQQRGEEMAAIEAVLHARRTDPRVADWLAEAEAQETDAVARAQLREIRHDHDRAVKVPPELAAEIARTTSLAQGVWAQARADEDIAAFAPTLEKVVRLVREQAAALADDGGLYDALLQGYEPGATGDGLAEMFGALRPRLVALRDKILDRPAPAALRGDFAEDGQLELSARLAAAFGYDFAHGRIDKAVHPFSSGSGLDVRITTRISASDPFNCFFSTIHEVGHATYEQGIDRAYLLTPLGRGVSMGVHESQSRIYENQLGRSRAFSGWLFEQMTAQFGSLSTPDASTFYAAVNRVNSDFIRTEADEVHYNLHVLMRFDLERALIAGDLQVGELEAAWNDRFASDFSIEVDRPSNGVLQDVHWSVGALGYFPTYTLGNVYAGCLFEALRRAVPDYETALAAGDPSPATTWLRENLQVHGGLYEPREAVARAAGFEPSEGPLLGYLEEKFGALYDL